MELTQKYLQGKYALITGSTSGIGLAIAKSLAVKGCNVILNGFGSEEEIDKIKETIQSDYDVTVHYCYCDLAKAEDIDNLVQEVFSLCPTLDILVNNAGFQKSAEIEDLTIENWQKNIDVMLTAPFKLIKAFLPKMRDEEFGRIINVSSILGSLGSTGEAAYCSVKHGIIGLTKAVALEVAEANITCNVICPGAVKTPLFMTYIKVMSETSGIREKKILHEAMDKFPSKDWVPVESVCFFS
ncbi:DgyrCDS14295 [Dimorphilus gyrociliatus]|uniref:3-oxoacyl-[acyl-carrier-protein] reductase n=1 Tax=Dimorphilus gyrociliatus TaxID=2664684 RepID=A0A7I8WDD9_9ANNE|nr:DgyrCDS14295 [Dimorphilus gyrociliatus]